MLRHTAKVVDGNDVLAVNEAAMEAVARARAGEGPTIWSLKPIVMWGTPGTMLADIDPRMRKKHG